MSNLFNTHAVVPYVSGKTKALEGQRLSKITYKVDKETGIKPDSKAVSLPVISWPQVEPHIQALSGEFLAVVHGAQDKLVRKLVEEGAKEIREEQCNLAATIQFMLEETKRIDGDTIRAWFSDSLKEPLLITFASKLGIPEDAAPSKEQEEKLAKILKGYEDSFAKLASGAAQFNEMQRTNMLKALDMLEADDDALASKFRTRLTKVNEDELLMNL